MCVSWLIVYTYSISECGNIIATGAPAELANIVYHACTPRDACRHILVIFRAET